MFSTEIEDVQTQCGAPTAHRRRSFMAQAEPRAPEYNLPSCITRDVNNQGLEKPRNHKIYERSDDGSVPKMHGMPHMECQQIQGEKTSAMGASDGNPCAEVPLLSASLLKVWRSRLPQYGAVMAPLDLWHPS